MYTQGIHSHGSFYNNWYQSTNRVILKNGNYQVWVSLLEQQFKSQWAHVTDTEVRPPAPRVVTPGVAAVAAGNGIAAFAAIAEITQEQVDADNRKIEDFECSAIGLHLYQCR